MPSTDLIDAWLAAFGRRGWTLLLTEDIPFWVMLLIVAFVLGRLVARSSSVPVTVRNATGIRCMEACTQPSRAHGITRLPRLDRPRTQQATTGSCNEGRDGPAGPTRRARVNEYGELE
jgi:hypothetical protein